jgi:hypothetical protein
MPEEVPQADLLPSEYRLPCHGSRPECPVRRDAWAGNAVLLLVVAHGLLTEGPWSFHAQYLRDVEAGRSRSVDAPVVIEADLLRCPSRCGATCA